MTAKIQKNSKTITFWALITVFFLPLVLAALIYVTRSSWSLETSTQGELLTPPLRTSLDLSQQPWLWRVVFINPNCNDDFCELQLAKIQSIQEATGKNFERVGTWLITNSDQVEWELIENFKGVLWYEIPTLPDTGLFIMDPTGLLILKYPTDTPGAQILDDLRHLLKVSQIG